MRPITPLFDFAVWEDDQSRVADRIRDKYSFFVVAYPT